MKTLKPDSLISVARGETPADLLFKNARIVNVFNGQIEKGDVAVRGGFIAGIGEYSQAKEIIDLEGKFLAPGLINGHTHLESSMLDVGEYARAVVPHGTAAIITDLHEIANVCGMTGINYVLNSSLHSPLDIFLMAPSCVPATHLETAGAVIGVDEIRQLLRLKRCIGLGEVMNFPGVIYKDPVVLKKVALAKSKVVDGHAPGLSGKDLAAYISAGIMSDHECVTLQEAQEKLDLGMRIMIREGSSEKNLDALLPLVNDKTYKRCIFVVDDRSCIDLLNDGDIDAVVRKAIRRGLDPVRAIQLATLNPAEYFRLPGLGAIAPGYLASLIVLNSLNDLSIVRVYHEGKLVAQDGKPLFTPGKVDQSGIKHTINLRSFGLDNFKLKAKGKTYPVIEAVKGQIITRSLIENVEVNEGYIQSDPSRDLLKLVVIERHKATGNTGLGLVKGFGLKQGALASSVAHDSHNIVAVGVTDEDIFEAVKAIQKMQGGLVAVKKGEVVASVPLPIAGLLSKEPLESVVNQEEKLIEWAKSLGCVLPAPFATLSFLALPVIPDLRLTDKGLVDVKAFKIID
jgi:adenine deaminase